MADKYLDHGAYGASNRLGLDTPAWGVPQEGDGTAKTVAAASGTASISFSAVPTSGTFSVCGVTISTTGVLNAASVDAAANTLATNINATTTAVAAGVSANLPQLRNLVYARGPSGGAPAGTCQIMMRVGSASLDYANNATCLIATTANNVSSTATNHQFAGGSGGCWGWFWNETLLGVASSIAIGVYGPMSANALIAGSIANGDVVHIRAGALINFSSGTLPITAHRAYGVDSNPVEFRIDNGTQWTADAGLNKVLEIRLSHPSSGMSWAASLGNRAQTYLILRGQKYANGLRNFKFSFLSATTFNYSFTISVIGGLISFYCTEFYDAGTGTATNGRLIIANNSASYNDIAHATVFNDCLFWSKRANDTFNRHMLESVNYIARVIFRNCEFRHEDQTSPLSPVFNFNNSAAHIMLELYGCKFTGYLNGSQLITSGSLVPVTAVDTVFGGISRPSAASLNSADLSWSAPIRSASCVTSKGKRDFYYENPQAILQWNSTANQPVLNAVGPDGTTKLSIRVQPSTVASLVSKAKPVDLPRIAKVNSLGSSRLRVTLEFLVDSSLPVWTTEDVFFSASYETPAGTLISDSTETPLSNGVSLPASTSTWYPENGSAEPFFGAATYVKRKLVLETSQAVAAGSEVSIFVNVARNTVNSTQFLFFDPDPVLEAIA